MTDKVWGKKTDFNPDAAILWLAVEGLRFFNLLNRDPFAGNQRENVMNRLLEKAREISNDESARSGD